MSIFDRLFGKTKLKPVETRVIKKNKPKVVPPVIKNLIVDKEQYIKDCLQKKYNELPEKRSWDSEPAFKKVLSPFNSGDYEAVCNNAEKVIINFSDYANLYAWWGKALLQLGLLEQARQVLKEGLVKANAKYMLCNLLGEVECKEQNLNQAVYWWSQGMHCQESLKESKYGGDVGAYLYLYYIAEGLGLSDCSRSFLLRVDSIRPGMIRFNAETANNLINMAYNNKNPLVEKVIKEIMEKYIVPNKKTTVKTNKKRYNFLVRHLEKLASLRRSSDENDVKEIEELAEYGDLQAVEILTSLAHGILLRESIAAEKALERINSK